MNKETQKQTSKFLSLVLRHQPEKIGLDLDEAGWADVEAVLAKCTAHGVALSRSSLELIVAENDKKRFAFSDDGSRIRASQGHSIEVELGYQPAVPPEILFHGTAARFLDAIREEGLQKGKRRHVHLSTNATTATSVGGRHGKPVILEVLAGKMHASSLSFYLSDNNVWLTDSVPPEFLIIPQL